MADGAMDLNLVQDFLTESRELLEQLDADLVALEGVADTPAAPELLNRIFRALHTIKGAASFLGLTAITTFSHAAEDALNRLRKGEVCVTPLVMDALLKSTDVVRGMIAQLAVGENISPGPADLMGQLQALAEKGSAAKAPAAPQPEPQNSPPQTTSAPGERPLQLPPQKVDLLSFMADDLKNQSAHLEQALAQARDPASRADAAASLAEIADELAKTAEFFELERLTLLSKLLSAAGPALTQLHDELLDELLVRLTAIRHLLNTQTQALHRSIELCWPLDVFVERIIALAAGQPLPADVAQQHHGNVRTVLMLDGIIADPAAAPNEAVSSDASPIAKVVPQPAPAEAGEGHKQAVATEQTIRVEVGRIEGLLNLVGQLVLTKNRFLAISRKARSHNLPVEFLEDVAGAANALDRLTGELQVGVMRTRMQPLAKLFERYPRVIRDIARQLDKRINLDIVGKETEVDKSVLELLADPLVHILRNAADHGVEMPQHRLAVGKSEVGTIRLAAQHQGSHVRVEITDDGKGLDREVLSRKAVEKGLVAAEEAAALSDSEVFRFIFAAGFSTAEKVTDLSGRGVGMDVVRTNVARLNGQVNVFSTKGRGTTIEILIPLTVAIMPAMVVGVGSSQYCIPLQSIVEIVKPERTALYSIHGAPVLRLRDAVLPLVNLQQRLGGAGQAAANHGADGDKNAAAGPTFAVVIGVGGQRAGLLVDRLIGQQEIVIKPLDDAYTAGGPFSGATIREDGDVSLILDVIQLIRRAQAPERAAA